MSEKLSPCLLFLSSSIKVDALTVSWSGALRYVLTECQGDINNDPKWQQLYAAHIVCLEGLPEAALCF